MAKTMTALVIMDGFGYRDSADYNAVKDANTPVFDKLMADYPHTLINASGLYVGLPEGQMGNSEVGHLNIGAGRVIYQDLTGITKSIEDGDFFEKKEFIDAIDGAKNSGKALHLFGLCSDGGVHSHLNHLYALLELAKKRGLERVYVHCFMDGRDVAPTSGKGFIEQLQAKIKEIGVGEIATIEGRYYAMDRDNRWERVERAYRALTLGEGNQGEDPVAMVQKSYDADVNDEFIEPIVITKDGKPVATVQDGDSVIFYNFRPDRAREITRTFIYDDFDGFERPAGKINIPHYVCMTQYDKEFGSLVQVAFKPETYANTLGEYVASKGMTQLRIAETEKYAHVTFFFNGGVEAPNKGEERVLIPSPKVATYDLQPEMSAREVTEEVVKRVNSGEYDLMVLNFANPDMVGHTGVLEAAIKAVETVDECVGKVRDAILQNGGRFLLTADHGNAELMRGEDGNPFTAHTSNPVPIVLVDDERKNAKLRNDGALCDIAPTLLQLMGLEQPAEMTGKTLIEG